MEQFRDRMRRQAFGFLRTQISVVVVLSVFVFLLFGNKVAFSFALGGGICAFANWVCVMRMFKSKTAIPSYHALSAVIAGEIRKIAVTILLFIISIKYIPIDFVAFITGYIVAQLSFLLVPLVKDKMKKKSESITPTELYA